MMLLIAALVAFMVEVRISLRAIPDPAGIAGEDVVTVEKRLLQAVVAVACLLPLIVGGQGIVHGPGAVRASGGGAARSGQPFPLYLGDILRVGIGFASCIPRIEARGRGSVAGRVDRRRRAVAPGVVAGGGGAVAGPCARVGDGDGGRAVADALAGGSRGAGARRTDPPPAGVRRGRASPRPPR